jgi:hypothetical protein
MKTRLVRRAALALAIALLSITVAASASAQTQSVTVAVNAINQIAFTGSPSLTITTATAGSNPTSVSDAVTATWAVTTNQTGAKITGSIASALPAGITLPVTQATPPGATTARQTAHATPAEHHVTRITHLAQGTHRETYTLSASAAAGVHSSTTKVVTYTITGGT